MEAAQRARDEHLAASGNLELNSDPFADPPSALNEGVFFFLLWRSSPVPLRRSPDAERVPPYNANLFPDQFRETPWSKTWTSRASAATLEVFGVDSNSGWGPNQVTTLQRTAGGLLARGRISDAELVALEGMLQTSYAQNTATVRAIVCHHSLSFRSKGLLTTIELDKSSIDKLLELAGHYHVAAILTGHTHDSHCYTYQRPDQSGKPWYIQELRSASTFSPDKTGEERGFLLNRIADDAGRGWNWTVWRYGWDGKAFVNDPNSPWQQFKGSY